MEKTINFFASILPSVTRISSSDPCREVFSCNRDQGSCFQALRQGTVALQRRFFETSCLFKDGSQRWSLAKELNSGSLHLSRHFDGDLAIDLFSGRGEGIMVKPEVKKAEHEKRQERRIHC